MGNKYGAVRSWSELCQRNFDSKAERVRGEELRMLQLAGQITDLTYQPRYVLCEKPRITYTADFTYIEPGRGIIVEDVKGVLTEASRIRIAWLKDKLGINVQIIRRNQ